MRAASLRPNSLKAMTDDLIAKENQNKYDNVEDSRGSKVQNENDCSIDKVGEDDNGVELDDKADTDTEDDDDDDDGEDNRKRGG